MMNDERENEGGRKNPEQKPKLVVDTAAVLRESSEQTPWEKFLEYVMQ